MTGSPNKSPGTGRSLASTGSRPTPIGPGRVWLALIPPLGAGVLQRMFWPYLQPFGWILFYPAVFFSSWIGGVRGGLGATFLSTALVMGFFLPPESSLAAADPKAIAAGVMFVGMGVWFSLFHGRLKRATEAAAEALAAAGLANRELASRVREREERFAAIAASSPGVLCSMRTSPDGRRYFDYVASGIEGICGLKAEDLGETLDRLVERIHPADRAGIRAAIAESSRTLVPLRYEFRVRHPGKGERWVEANSLASREADGGVVWHGVMTDITEQKRAAETLRVSEERLRLAIEAAQLGTWERSFLTNRLVWSERQEAMMGFARGTFPGTLEAFLELVHPDDMAVLAAAQRRALVDDGRYQVELRFKLKNGQARWGYVCGQILFGADGEPERMLGIELDITERRLAEDALRASEDQFRTIFEVASIGMAQADPRTGKLLRVNGKMSAITGYPVAELIGKRFSEITHPEDREKDWAAFQRVVRGEAPEYQLEKRYVRKDGELVWVNVNVTIIRNAAGEPERSMAAVQDIDERKRGEEERDKLTLLVEKSRDFIAIRDLAGAVTFMNAGARAMIGLPPERALDALPAADFEPESWRGVLRDRVIPLVREQGSWEGEMQLRHLETGAPIDVMSSIILVRDPAGQPVGFATVARDITEEKRANEKLAAERTLLRTLFDLLPDYIYVKDRDHRLLACNDRCAARFGLESTAALIGKTDADLFPAEVAGRFREEEIGVLQGGTVVDREESYVLPDGVREVVLTTKIPLRDGAGNIIGIIGCGHDITKHKENEEAIRRLNAELERRVIERTAQLEEANRELEAFSYSVSHDLRAPLRAVDGFSLAVMEDFGALLPKDGQRQLQTIRTSAQRMGELIDDLLAFSRLSRRPLNKQPVKMEPLVRSVLADLAGETAGREIEIVVGALPVCDGDPRLLRQVWMNLLANALKYTRRRARAVVEVGWADEAGERIYFVRDNGSGFDMRYAGKLFTVFQRLHRAEDYEGTGVGLAIVQRVVHRHGGRVWAEAAVDRGATFRFTLEEKAHL